MHAESTETAGRERLEVSFTDKPVSGWGGLVAVVQYLDKLDVRGLLRRVLPDGRTSPNQIPVVDIAMVLWSAVLTGARRFAHVERLRADEVVRSILGVDRMPSAMTVTRYFGGFVRSQVELLSDALWSLVKERIPHRSLGSVLDLDSTVFERYGSQEGSLKGHNPRKHGRPSHHPLLAMLAEAKLIVHAWLRSGNTASARGAIGFLDETLARLQGVPLYALRADSGFCAREFLLALEARDLRYAIVARMTPHLKKRVAGLRTWRVFGAGLEAAEAQYRAPSWQESRRVVVVREELRERPDAKGRRLLDAPGYAFHAIVTTLELDPVDAWRFYNSRADCENRLKELKDDFGAAGFCLQSFDGTEAVFRLICALFNLMACFKREVMANESPQLSKLRTDLIVVGGIVGSCARKVVLRLGLQGDRRARFSSLLRRIAALVPTVAQLEQDQTPHGPKPWRPRRRSRLRGGYAQRALAFN